MTTGVSLVVCDFDGTLLRLEVDWHAVRAALRRQARELGIAVGPADGVSALLGLIAAAGAQALARARTLVARAEVAAVADAQRNVALLERLRDARVAVLTNNSRRAVDAALPALELEPLTVCGREDAPPKPDPQGLRELLVRCATPPHEALVVGDSSADFAAACAAGVRAMHVRDLAERWER